jgi:hypothetical protein
VSCCIKQTSTASGVAYQFYAREFSNAQLRNFLGDDVGVDAGFICEEEVAALGRCFASALQGPVTPILQGQTLNLDMMFSLGDNDDPISHNMPLQEVEGGTILPVLYDDIEATLTESTSTASRKRALLGDGSDAACSQTGLSS